MRELQGHPELMSLNTATLGHRDKLSAIVGQVAAAGFGAIAPWRREIDEDNPEKDAKSIRDAGLSVSGYCRTAYLSGPDKKSRDIALQDNIKAVEAAAVLGAECFVAVVGGLAEGSRDAKGSRCQIIDGLARLAETSSKLGVPIALEPLHPFYAADRSLLNTIGQALEWCDELDPGRTGTFGVCLDAYHIWWDPDVKDAIARCKGRVLGYHVCDWLVPTEDPLLDRGMPGDGVIDLKPLRALVEGAGFAGKVEIEIFSKNNWWKRPPEEVLSTCVERIGKFC